MTQKFRPRVEGVVDGIMDLNSHANAGLTSG